MTATAPAADWSAGVHDVLGTLGVRQVAYVPDAGHRRLIERCREDADKTALPLTTEEEGVAVLAGAWLGGEKGVLLMQSSGVGNCINMLSLTRACRFPLLMLVTMRGQWGEFNPWQVPMGQNCAAMLEMAGVLVHSVDKAGEMAETVYAAGRIAFDGPAAAAVLISQRLIGIKTFGR